MTEAELDSALLILLHFIDFCQNSYSETSHGVSVCMCLCI